MLAYVAVVLGDLGKAGLLYLASARAAVEQSGAERLRAGVLLGEAALHARRGESETAVDTWTRAETLLRELGGNWEAEERLLIDRLLELLGPAGSRP
jgi:hypothetical protein